ncbi:MAG TPA: hypothetical protein PK358_08150 [Spirochaetota bacterium]|nr:hypothetical protein [Spirochaetota bacterium]HPJ34791.1 hypothetical protein [Spirochaetota bacterium]
MKRLISFVLILMLSVSFSFAKPKMPADFKALTSKIIKHSTEYYNDLLKVKSAKQLAAAINTYAGKMEKLTPEIKAMDKKYGLSKTDDDELPFDTSGFEKEMEDFEKKISGSDSQPGVLVEKITRYAADPEVQKALTRLSNVLDEQSGEDEGNDEGYDEDEQDEGQDEYIEEEDDDEIEK